MKIFHGEILRRVSNNPRAGVSLCVYSRERPASQPASKKQVRDDLGAYVPTRTDQPTNTRVLCLCSASETVTTTHRRRSLAVIESCGGCQRETPAVCCRSNAINHARLRSNGSTYVLLVVGLANRIAESLQ